MEFWELSPLEFTLLTIEDSLQKDYRRRESLESQRWLFSGYIKTKSKNPTTKVNKHMSFPWDKENQIQYQKRVARKVESTEKQKLESYKTLIPD